jgi:TonB-linked SusC/RagA family outer membrane protein
MKKCVRASLSGLFLFLCVLIVQAGFSQGITVTGKVSDENNAGLGGVTVQVKGTTNSTQTGGDGTFSLNVPNLNAVLVFTYVGYLQREMGISGNTVDVILRPDPQSLEGVVVVGYGTQKKSDVTGSLVKISAETIRERPAQNVLQAMQGKAAGVQVSSNFKPGELPVVRIRGTRSPSGSNEPLYVIDGIPLVNSLGVSSFSINDLNPNDIASIEILKDASATAIYGSRGANGVVLVTTVKGKKGRMTLDLASTVSLDKYKSLTDWMNGGQYIDRWRLALMNGRQYQDTQNKDLNAEPDTWYPDPFLDQTKMGLSSDQIALNNVWAGYEWEEFGVTPKMRPTTAAEKQMGWPDFVPIYNPANIKSFDWLDAVTRTGLTQNHQIALSAGSDMSRLSISLGYYKQLGVQRDQDYTRYTANISGELSPVKWFTLGTSLLAAHSSQNFGVQPPNTSNTGPKDLYSRAADQFPYAQPRDEDGFFIRNAGGNLSLWNPIIDIDQAKNDRRMTSIMANIFAEIKFTPWLKYRINFGPQYRQFRAGVWRGPDATPHLSTSPNTASYATDENFSWVVENLLFVDKTIAKNHRIGVTLLQSSQRSRRENSSISASGVINPLSLWYDLASNTAGNPGIGTGFTENTLTSFMGRLNYTLFDKYLLTASIRADGASVLAPGHKWDYFPSMALAWKMQEENFIKGINWITELKPRFGYGVTGASSVNPYTTSGPLSRNNYAWGSNPAVGYLPQLVQNPLLKWEQTAQMNIGLDFAVLNGRLSGTIEYYDQKTTDLIFRKTLPAVSGYVEKFENVGETKNNGVEISLSGIPVQRRNFSWSVDVNWSKNNEEIVSLIFGKQDMVANGLFIGKPIQVYRQFENEGIWGKDPKDQEEMNKFRAKGAQIFPGMIKVKDQNGDSLIDGNDMVILGSPRAKWSGGITNTFNYKNWSLSTFIYFRWGQMYFGGFPNSYGGTNPNGRVENDIWSWDNTNGRWPMPNTGVTNTTSAMQYNDGSFGVVRNISLSYTFPARLLQKVSMKNLVVNFQVINPFIFGPGVVKWGINPDDDTNWSIASSNTNPLGGTNNNTILPQSFVFGIRAGF